MTIRAMRRFAMIALFISAGGCGEGPAAPVPTPSPVPPSKATLELSQSFAAFSNGLGDPLEALNIAITTNIQTAFRATVKLETPDYVHPGNKRTALCGSGDSCVLKTGSNLVDYWCSKTCPAGEYKVLVDVCSYVEAGSACDDQMAPYVTYVGALGARLTGNPLALKDAAHAAILNLHSETAFTTPGFDRAAAAAAKHQQEAQGTYTLTISLGYDAVNSASGTKNSYCQYGSLQLCAQGWDKWATAVRAFEKAMNGMEVPICYTSANHELHLGFADFDAAYRSAGVGFGGQASAITRANSQLNSGVHHLDNSSTLRSSASCP